LQIQSLSRVGMPENCFGLSWGIPILNRKRCLGSKFRPRETTARPNKALRLI
jgi:hypothetical protein